MKGVYDNLGKRYDRVAKVVAAISPITRFRQQLLGTAKGDVLEVAIGTGVNLPFYPKDVRLTGVDFSAPMLEAAKEKARQEGITMTAAQADAQALPFADKSFDTIVCTLAACTFAQPEKVFAEMRRVLRPGGQALLIEHVQAEGKLGRALLNTIAPLTIKALGCHPNRHTVETLAALGFNVEEKERAVGGILRALVAT